MQNTYSKGPLSADEKYMDDVPVRKRDVFVFDIDGTLANHKGVRGPFEEHKVFHDKPIEPVWTVLNALVAAGYSIVFLSGRTDGCREDTIQWLNLFIEHKGHVDPNKYQLFMRKKGDQRKDSIVKKEIYDAEILPTCNVLGVFDDRLQVCRMLYENNLFCFNVNQGLVEF
jgi:hypothetical protein